jgi:hypothetical protein
MSVDIGSTRTRPRSQGTVESAYFLGMSGSLNTLGRTAVQWLTGGSLSAQSVVVGSGCALATMLPLGLPYRIAVVVIPLLFIGVAHPTLQQALLALGRAVTPRRSRPGEPAPMPVAPARSSAAAKLYWSDNSPGESVFLRSFDRFEEILQEALVLELGQIAAEFSLSETIDHLTGIGFLTPADCNEWADCLAVRCSLLLTEDDGRRQPRAGKVDDALGRMLRLQVVLTDRRRLLFDQEREVGQQEDAVLREIAGAID